LHLIDTQIAGVNQDRLALLYSYGTEILVVDLCLAVTNNDLGSAILFDIDSVLAFLEQRHRNRWSVDFEVDRVIVACL